MELSGWLPLWYGCRYWYPHSWGGENLKAALYSTDLQSLLSAWPWMHQALSEELKSEHKFSFEISKCLPGNNPNQAEVNAFLGNTLNVACTSLPNGAR